MIQLNYRYTIYACFIGYITQAIANNLSPLLFSCFMHDFHLSTMQITTFVVLNFMTQILSDILASKYADKFGYKISIITAHICSFVGLFGLTIFPRILNPFVGLMIATIIYAIGSGFIEVLISPIVEACPTDNKESIMSLLHSFYCWGSVGVILFSTILFYLFGKEYWYVLPILWSLVPLLNSFFFTKVEVPTLVEVHESMSLKQLSKYSLFYILLGLMIMSGACEHAMSQWASTFCELGLNITKTTGDLLGPCMFAILMGLSRVFYGKVGHKIDLLKFIQLSSILCFCSFLLVSLSSNVLFNLIGCALCGLSVGIFWPGVTSIASKSFPKGGTILFAYLALAGDLGCIVGPYVIGFTTTITNNIQIGFLLASLFPILIFIFTILYKRKRV